MTYDEVMERVSEELRPIEGWRITGMRGGEPEMECYCPEKFLAIELRRMLLHSYDDIRIAPIYSRE